MAPTAGAGAQNRRPRLLADSAIPDLAQLFGNHWDLSALPAQHIDRAALRHADALLVRSVTRVDAELLDGTPVRFVGTATSGTDHLDLHYLRQADIAVGDGAGGNARAVAEYVLAVLAALLREQGGELSELSLGLVGCGHTGGQLRQLGRDLRLQVRACDPWRPDCAGTSLADALSCKVVSLHTPLVRDGPEPTLHLLDGDSLAALSGTDLLINTSRGEVLAPDFVAGAERMRPQMRVALDVWYGEPAPTFAELPDCWLASPHLAGHSAEGKRRCTLLAAGKAAAAWQLPQPELPPLPPLPPLDGRALNIEADIDSSGLPLSLLLAAVGLPQLHAQMRALASADKPLHAFAKVRAAAPQRREFSAQPVRAKGLSQQSCELLRLLGFALV